MMADFDDYYELKARDRVCPIMSTQKVSYNGELVKCIGERCMWYGRCRQYDDDLYSWPEEYD